MGGEELRLCSGLEAHVGGTRRNSACTWAAVAVSGLLLLGQELCRDLSPAREITMRIKGQMLLPPQSMTSWRNSTPFPEAGRQGVTGAPAQERRSQELWVF